jgi:hypothetical protein
MTEYANHPEAWTVIKISNSEKVIYKVFASWRGGYISSDYWQLNSGIVKAEYIGDSWVFHGNSGSVYVCKNVETKHSPWSDSVLYELTKKLKNLGHEVEILSYTTDFSSINFGVKNEH